MTLSFTQTINGKPNYFVEKIWAGYTHWFPYREEDWFLDYYDAYVAKFGGRWDRTDSDTYPNEKIHTIRLDPHSRWRAGMDIHPVINNRTPQRFQFAPTIPCVSVQRVDIAGVKPHDDKMFMWIDGQLISQKQCETVAINDGFDSAEAFFEYFKDGITNGKLINWTPLKY